MSQPEISPLARRLAEENNVDWRDLHGSGAGGKVVERDVLEYLARVMAGEEDIDPTPEPTPEGMEAWPDEDIQAFQQEMRASHQNVGLQEIQQELSAADRLSHGPADALLENGAVPPVDEVPSTPAGPPPEADVISEDIFLFDDDEDDGAVAPPEGAAPRSEEVEDGLLVEGDESAAWDVGDDALGGEELWAGGSEEESEALPDVFGAGDDVQEPGRASGPALFDEGVGGSVDEPGPVAEGAPELEVPPLGDLDEFGGSEGASRAGVVGERSRWAAEFEDVEDEGPALEEPALDEASFEEPPAGVEGFAGEGWGVEEPGSRPDDLAEGFEPPPGPARASADAALEGEEPGREAPAEAWTEPGPDAAGWPAEPEPRLAEEAAAAAAEPAMSEPETVEPETAGAETADVPAEPPSVSERVAGGADIASAAPAELPLVSFGTLLRRHIDVTALAGAQLAVGLELGESEPLSPAPFLLRAAAKAVADGGWGDGRVAMVGWGEAGALRTGEIDDAAGRPFVELARALPSALSGGAAEAHGVGLVVADMSALDVDEAVLNVQAPLLTLGRILYDNQRGSYRSTLSLAGDVPPERGARLLARVAELLDAPVRLLL